MGREDDRAAINQLAAQWQSGWLTGDADLLLSLYADDPVVLPQDQPVIIGKDAIRPMYEALFKEYDFKSDSSVTEIVADRDLGYVWSGYRLTAIPKAGGEPMKVAGKSIFIVKRGAGGAWKISRLMDNSDGPPKPESLPLAAQLQ